MINQSVKKLRTLVNIHYLPIHCFLRDIHWGYLSLEDADNTQSNFAIKIKNLIKL